MMSEDKSVSSLGFRRVSSETNEIKNYNAITIGSDVRVESEEPKNPRLCRFWSKIPFTGRQMVVILLLCYGNFCVGSAYSLLAPFFPLEVIIIFCLWFWLNCMLLIFIECFDGQVLYLSLEPISSDLRLDCWKSAIKCQNSYTLSLKVSVFRPSKRECRQYGSVW